MVLLLLGSADADAATATPRFFRVSGPSDSTISTLGRDGLLRWTSLVSTGLYRIECSEELNPEGWRPFSDGRFTNQQWLLKVLDATPRGDMAFIPGGRFQMGDSQNDPFVTQVARPVHTVTVGPFFAERFEVTNRRLRSILQWAFDRQRVEFYGDYVVSGETGTNVMVVLGRYDSEISFTNRVFSIRAGREEFPAVYVTWNGAVAACNYRSEMEGLEPAYRLDTMACDFSKTGYRLPTEAEWEFAARGGHAQHRFPWADTDLITHARANYRSDTNTTYDVSPTRDFHPDYTSFRPRSSPVGTFAPNDFGLFDMAGNVWEWTGDWHVKYSAAEQVNPVGPAEGSMKVFRGGSWLTKSERVTCAMRYPYSPLGVFDDIGFRMVLSCPAPSSAGPR